MLKSTDGVGARLYPRERASDLIGYVSHNTPNEPRFCAVLLCFSMQTLDIEYRGPGTWMLLHIQNIEEQSSIQSDSDLSAHYSALVKLVRLCC